MPANKTVEEPKPRYELRRQSDHYATLWEGDHCLASICIKKPRGVLDAQLILLACNSYAAQPEQEPAK